MKHILIGTAGHVDHGKTALVQALTGIDTDRLAEEKRRGITIEVGYAPLSLPGAEISIIDVPGHEKFIRHMISGAGGIDFAMLVVAANEGFMPQTAEHLDILQLLGIPAGAIVLTKADLAGPAALDALRRDLRQRTAGTFLEDAPILPVSVRTGEGLPALRQVLGQLAAVGREKDPRRPFRLPIDRVFSVKGFGTVVTGTMIEGTVRTGEHIQLFPSGAAARVRGIQVHGRDTGAARAGQRAALALSGVAQSDIHRGDTAAPPGSLAVSRMLDVHLHALERSRRAILHNTQVHLHLGATAYLAKVVLLDREQLLPGEEGYAQLRLSQPVSAKAGDHFILRFFSPLETIGGGIILDDAPLRHSRGDQRAIQALQIRESGTKLQQLAQQLTAAGAVLSAPKDLSQDISPADTAALLRVLVLKGDALEPLPGRFLSQETAETVWAACDRVLTAYHADHPLHGGMALAELRQKLRLPPLLADCLLEQFLREGRLRRTGDRFALAHFQVCFTRRQRAIRALLLDRCQSAGLDFPTRTQALAWVPLGDRESCAQVLESLLTTGELAVPAPGLLVHGQVLAQAWETACQWFDCHDALTLAQFRDLLHTSRDRALLLLEAFDRAGVTLREGDLRRRIVPPPGRPFSGTDLP